MGEYAEPRIKKKSKQIPNPNNRNENQLCPRKSQRSESPPIIAVINNINKLKPIILR